MGRAASCALLNYTPPGSITQKITPLAFIETALAENRRMMARLDRRLIKPTIMPAIATMLLLGIRMLPPRAASASAPAALHAAEDQSAVETRARNVA